MTQFLATLARSIADSGAHDVAVDWLRNVPGLPPIVQTLHLLSIAVVLGSIMVINLRVLGVAVPSQDPAEMTRRLARWTWGALPVLLFSGLLFVLARPQRYFTNPMFGLKFAMLLPALAITAALFLRLRREPVGTGTRVLACFNVLCWIGVVLAGRWIAYVDYIFPPEDF